MSILHSAGGDGATGSGAQASRAVTAGAGARSGYRFLPIAVVCAMAALLFTGAAIRLFEAAYWHWTEGQGGVPAAYCFFFLGALILGAGKWSLLFGLAFNNERRLERERPAPPMRWPLVSVCVPAYNEEKTIEDTVASLLALDYPAFEIIVVDDGSTDDTLARLRRLEQSQRGVRLVVLTKPNGGKSSALNLAFREAQGELFLCVDADSRLERDALRLLVIRMQDPDVEGVAGQIRVRNRDNLLTCLQAIEYLMVNGAVRMAQTGSGSVLLVPGPIGLFRRSALAAVVADLGASSEAAPAHSGQVEGPFSADTFAEDFDVSLELLARGGRIVYEPLAVALTRAPDWSLALLNQRYRWNRGHYQVVRKHWRRARDARAPLRPAVVRWLAITHGVDLFFQPLVYIVGFLGLMTYVASGGDVIPLFGWYLGFILLNVNAAAYWAEVHGDDPSIVWSVVGADLYQSVLLTSAWAFAAFDEARGGSMRW